MKYNDSNKPTFYWWRNVRNMSQNKKPYTKSSRFGSFMNSADYGTDEREMTLAMFDGETAELYAHARLSKELFDVRYKEVARSWFESFIRGLERRNCASLTIVVKLPAAKELDLF